MKTVATATVTSTPTHYRQQIQTGKHTLVADEPTDAGGLDAGPAPYDYLLAGLGACTTITLQMYAERKGWNIGDVNVDLTLSKNKEGESRIERIIHCSQPLTDEQWAKLLEIAGKTPVTLTLKAGAVIESRRAD
ncbi:MAG TPA: OsmC family protein [Pseudomonadales bacterium]|nr:OsmC family protein [Pseudomonadales bacterium]